MKRLLVIVLVVCMVLAFAVPALAKSVDVKTITNGEILYSDSHYLAGEAIPTGFDAYGYNYQGHMFKGSYFNSYAGGAGFPAWEGDDESYLTENPLAVNHWAWSYREVKLSMKWNDAWISNTSKDGDVYLDRHYGFDSYSGSGAWLTNHQSETGIWNYFTKIVAAPADAYTVDGVWFTADGLEMGPVIWGAFATVQTVSNDPAYDEHGLLYKSDTPNLGGW